jgi:Protein of unknown function (DUF1553)/Protein of unknown function (DUF1549)/Planctomycete cytochrome C/EF hand
MLTYRIGVLAAGYLIVGLIANAPDMGAQPKADPEATFKRADANSDGKVSRDEWRKLTENAPKFKTSGLKGGDFIFDRLDENRDGFLTLEEYKKVGELGQGKGFPKKDFFGKKETPKKDPNPGSNTTPDKPITADQLAFFEKSIRPVLIKECYSCHSADAEKVKGNFLLDTRDGIRKGADNGPAVVPFDAKRSVVIKALKHVDEDLAMPPKKKLDDSVIADFEKWIAMGAPDPRDGSAKVAKNEIDIEKGRQFWAFQPVKKPTAPTVKDASWPKSDIDRYILASLEAKGLKPVADADARTLLRRVYFDVIGLPPTPEDTELFVKEYAAKPQAALEAVVDKLLVSPQFGERWGRHWLDVARFAESSGRANNFSYPHAWRYRDYVIDSFNKDKPYDQFVREQLAGDLLSAKDDAQKAEYLVATGFLAIGPKTHNERNRTQFAMDLADEQIDATFQAFNALTVACARCHDHKFDPIPQKDYYAVAGIFRSTETCFGTIRIIQNNQVAPLITLPKDANVVIPHETLTAERRAGIDKQIQDVRDAIAKIDNKSQNAFLQRIIQQGRISQLQSQLALYESDGTPKPIAMGARERSFAQDSPIYNRGEIDQPGSTVKRGFPQVMTSKQPSIGRSNSGRKELAEWIASKDNTLTARVMVNRIWLHLIGHGLVGTPDNFGASGQTPSHPALLDSLATQFVDNGWSVKKMIRSIVLSHTYQLGSQYDEKNFEVDPDNVLVWRIPKRRLEAEALRDSMLLMAGRLDLTPPKGSPVARRGEGNAGGFGGGGGPFGKGGGGDQASNDAHRTVYMGIIRDQVPEVLTIFDFPDPSLIIGERPITTIPAQSLYLMNNPFVIRQAEGLADKLLASGDDDAGKLTRAYQLAFSRPPSEKELKAAQDFIASYGKTQTKRATWTALTQALIASAEFSHR